MDKPDFSNSCYKTKDDKRHNTIWGVNNLASETQEEREERLKNIRESRGKWVWDNGKLIRAEDYHEKEVDAPKISKWDSEWTLISTGRRMSKGELKRYCREHGKRWEN